MKATRSTRPTISADTKAAIKFLVATHSTAISIMERDGGCTIRVGTKIDTDAISVFWLPEPNAIAISRQARRDAGERPDAAKMIAALQRAAADWSTTLTPHDVAVQRAASSVKRLDAAIEGLRTSGQLSIFNDHYKAARKAAAAQGDGFMPYEVALARLRMALVPYLIGGRSLKDFTGLFAEVFGPQFT